MSLYEIVTHWSMLDLLQANQVLNAIEIAEARAQRAAESKAKAKR